ncbi:uncharacterized protein LOC143366489 [Andrena cerasifolii]|uniref:uncharacterized protein LOC143366489 n=1 Tax=Andrena cerasifolii TaxID=2819439 RepID=UPI004037E4B8
MPRSRTNSIPYKGSRSVKSQQPSAKTSMKNKTPFALKGNGGNNPAVKGQHALNAFSQNKTITRKRVESKDHCASTVNKCCDDMDRDDRITVLRKEIEDWRINEILTARSEGRLTGTPSEQRSCSYVASGETTKRQPTPNNPSTSYRSCVDLSATT